MKLLMSELVVSRSPRLKNAGEYNQVSAQIIYAIYLCPEAIRRMQRNSSMPVLPVPKNAGPQPKSTFLEIRK